jgi:hypothetical protein
MEVGDGGGGKICSLLFRVMMFTVDDITTHRRKTLFQAFDNRRHNSQVIKFTFRNRFTFYLFVLLNGRIFKSKGHKFSQLWMSKIEARFRRRITSAICEANSHSGVRTTSSRCLI